MDFSDKVILITGASSGIGKELAVKLSKQNCKLILIARRINILNELVDYLKQTSKAEILPIKCDVGNKNEVVLANEKIMEKFNKIDIAILNAGYAERMTINDYNSKIAEDTFGANVFGIIYWVEQLIPEFLKNKTGLIVGVTSLADNRGYSGSGFYCASKAAASVYLEGLRIELKKYNLKVITVKPGFVKTPMTDKNEFSMPFLMKAGKAADIIIDGIKQEKRVIRFPLPTVFGAKIISLIPSRFYEYLGSNGIFK